MPSRQPAGQWAYPSLRKMDMPGKVVKWFYITAIQCRKRGGDDVKLFIRDFRNCADHWAGDHSGCANIDPTRLCVVKGWGSEHAYYAPNSPDHRALKDLLCKMSSEKAFIHYTRARKNTRSEVFNSMINKYATKRVHWAKTHEARLHLTALDWNENRHRGIIKRVDRKGKGVNTATRKREPHKNIYEPKTYEFKSDVFAAMKV